MINLLDAVKNYKNLPQQNEAFIYLDKATPSNIKQQFAILFRNDPKNTTPINFLNAVKYFTGLDHQVNALKYLNGITPNSVKNQFAIFYRTEPKVPTLLTKSQLAHIWEVNENSISDLVIKDFNNCLNVFKINTKARIRHFLAQVSHESGAGKWVKELASGNAYEYVRDLGNTQPGDGRKFRGAGLIQLTGRDNYQAFANYIKDQKVMQGVDYVAIHYPATSAGFFWMNNDLNDYVDSGATVRQVSRAVNGKDPANGLADREYYYKRALKVI